MKRGNTALKRVVSVTSVAAMAIAGAVLAAPAANAAPSDYSVDSVRAKPAADAAWVTGEYVPTAGYSASGTGTAPILKPKTNNQPAQGLQIALQSDDAGTPEWSANDTIIVTLSGGATFAGTPSVSVDPTLRVLAGLDTVAGYAGNNAHTAAAAGVANSGLGANALAQPTLNPAKTALTIKLNVADPAVATAANTDGYLVSVDGIVVNTDGSATGPVIATVTGTANAAGSTTLGFVRKAEVTLTKAAGEADASGNLTLPDIVVTEGKAGALTAATYTLNVTTDPAGGQTKAATVTDLKTTVAGTGLALTTNAAIAAAGNGITFTVGTPSTVAGSVTISGVQVTGVPRGADVKVELAASTETASQTATSKFSYVQNAALASAKLTTAAAEPRIAGADRYATAAEIADMVGVTDSIVIANGESAKQGVDALSANYLAATKSSPILLTSAATLPAATADALVKLFKGFSGTGDITVYVLGKSDSVSDAVRARIVSVIKSAATLAAGKDVKVVEVAGGNRYETSAAAATTGGVGSLALHSLTTTTAWARTAFLASGKVNADALAAGSIAAAAGIPVLLADGDKVDAKVSDAIKALGITQVIALGGTDRISDALLNSLKDIGVTTTKRIGESNRYETAAALYTWAFAPVNPAGTETNRGLGWATGSADLAYLANGTDGFADALAVGPLAGKDQAPILTVQKDKLGDAAAKFLKDNKAQLTDGVWALGQTDRIGSDVINAALAALK